MRTEPRTVKTYHFRPEAVTVRHYRLEPRVVERTVKTAERDKDGKDVTVTRKFKEKVVVYWSKAFPARRPGAR